MKVRTESLQGPALNWAVASIVYNDHVIKVCNEEGWPSRWIEVENFPGSAPMYFRYYPSQDWKDGGPILGRYLAGVFKYNKLDPGEPDTFGAHVVVIRTDWRGDPLNVVICKGGTTPLIAAMRCFVASKLGDEIDVPEELA